MNSVSAFIEQKLAGLTLNNSYRKLPAINNLSDFCSNDYLGFAKSVELKKMVEAELQNYYDDNPGSTGSRLLTGNYRLFNELECEIASFHNSERALIFNSGYNANLGLLSSVPQQNDTIFYDELVHVSIRDGIRLSRAGRSYSFRHNDIEELKKKFSYASGNVFVVVESVYSMDGDTPDFSELVNICQEKNACLIVDEAHSFGVCGDKGSGLIQKLSLENMIFARILTFGKALGCHGAAIAGSNTLIEYLINYCRPFIYTTALPLYSLVFIECAYRFLPESDILREKLQSNVNHFLNSVSSISENFTKSNSQIQSIIIPGNERVKRIAAELQLGGYDVRAILKPSVKTGTERLRISLHSYNTHEQISGLAERLIKLLLLY